jgi:hypothetical protein
VERFTRSLPAVPDLPQEIPQWVRDGSLRRVLEALAEDLRTRGDLDLSECFIDGTFIVAKKGGTELVRLSGAKARTHGGGRLSWSSCRRQHGVC